MMWVCPTMPPCLSWVRPADRLQQLIDQRWNTKKALAADTVKPLHYVPQLYAYSVGEGGSGQKVL
jgi:hypothetical protein